VQDVHRLMRQTQVRLGMAQCERIITVQVRRLLAAGWQRWRRRCAAAVPAGLARTAALMTGVVLFSAWG
jgi:hypothetical protein